MLKNMNKEDKELLLKDLCARLPYHPKIHVEHRIFELIETVDLDMWGFDGKIKLLRDDNETFCYISLEECKPYLRPMSSMTEEEFAELHNICPHSTFNKTNIRTWVVGLNGSDYGRITRVDEMCIFINWLLENHFDFMGLIPKNLAIEITESNNPYKN